MFFSTIVTYRITCPSFLDWSVIAVNADLKFPTFAEMKFPRSFVLARCFAR
jgi:hypothetical protein